MEPRQGGQLSESSGYRRDSVTAGFFHRSGAPVGTVRYGQARLFWEAGNTCKVHYILSTCINKYTCKNGNFEPSYLFQLWRPNKKKIILLHQSQGVHKKLFEIGARKLQFFRNVNRSFNSFIRVHCRFCSIASQTDLTVASEPQINYVVLRFTIQRTQSNISSHTSRQIAQWSLSAFSNNSKS